jgi:hypothetical protein
MDKPGAESAAACAFGAFFGLRGQTALAKTLILLADLTIVGSLKINMILKIEF